MLSHLRISCCGFYCTSIPPRNNQTLKLSSQSASRLNGEDQRRKLDVDRASRRHSPSRDSGSNRRTSGESRGSGGSLDRGGGGCRGGEAGRRQTEQLETSRRRCLGSGFDDRRRRDRSDSSRSSGSRSGERGPEDRKGRDFGAAIKKNKKKGRVASEEREERTSRGNDALNRR